MLSVHDLLQAPRNSGRDNAAGIIIVWWTSPPLILQIHSLYQIATGTPSHVPPRRRGIIITIIHDFGTNCIVHSDWDSAPTCVCGPNFISDFIGESPIFSVLDFWCNWRANCVAAKHKIKKRFFVIILFVASRMKRWNFKLREQLQYKLLSYELVNPTIKISL